MRQDLSAGYLNHLVNGKRPAPALEVIELIANAIKTPPHYFAEYRLAVVRDSLSLKPWLVDRLFVGPSPLQPGLTIWRIHR